MRRTLYLLLVKNHACGLDVKLATEIYLSVVGEFSKLITMSYCLSFHMCIGYGSQVLTVPIIPDLKFFLAVCLPQSAGN